MVKRYGVPIKNKYGIILQEYQINAASFDNVFFFRAYADNADPDQPTHSHCPFRVSDTEALPDLKYIEGQQMMRLC